MHPTPVWSVVLLMSSMTKEKNSGSRASPGLLFAFGRHVFFFTFSLIRDSSSWSWPWHFWRVQGIYFLGSPLVKFVWYFLMIRFWLYSFSRRTTEVMLWPSQVHPGTCVMSDALMVTSALITWSAWYQSDFSTIKLQFLLWMCILWGATLRLCKCLISHQGITH